MPFRANRAVINVNERLAKGTEMISEALKNPLPQIIKKKLLYLDGRRLKRHAYLHSVAAKIRAEARIRFLKKAYEAKAKSRKGKSFCYKKGIDF